ncbi:hypothetical protein A3K80_02905 [Candidatus Bathyarchaeota archaeon RBG_13_38_9]|nr:MAG: hypothetical protein A3K80_02905 [Candidatus Bathyarchaeota archaeon RBG_13_38_9]
MILKVILCQIILVFINRNYDYRIFYKSLQITSGQCMTLIEGVYLPLLLAAAVLAVLPQEFNLPNSEIYMPIALTVILTTAIITTIGPSTISHSKISVGTPYPMYSSSDRSTGFES